MRRSSSRSRIGQTAQQDHAKTATVDQRCVARHTSCTDLHVVYEGSAPRIEVRVPDISPQGMFINTPQAFAVGSSVRVRFRLGHSGKLVHARGEVRYCLPGVGIGVEFVEIRPEDRAAIAERLSVEGDDW